MTKKNIWYFFCLIPMIFPLSFGHPSPTLKAKIQPCTKQKYKKENTEIAIWHKQKGEQMTFSCYLSSDTIPDKTA